MKTWLDLFYGMAALICGVGTAFLVDRYLTALERKSAFFAPVSCLRCGRVREAWDRAPLLSWLLNGGKCRFCGAALSGREPVLSVLILALWPVAVQLWMYRGAVTVLLIAATGSALLCAAGICWAGAADRPVLLPVFLCAGIISVLVSDGSVITEKLFGAAGLLVFCLLMRFLPKGGRRLRVDSLLYMTCAGFLMGWKSCFVVLPAAVIILAILLLSNRKKQKNPSQGKAEESCNADPEGRGMTPDLCVLGGGAAALLLGRTLMNGYLRLFLQIG